MNKINRVVYKTIIAVILLVGALNVLDILYAADYTNAATSGTATFTPSVVINPSATVSVSSETASLAVTPTKSGTFAASSAVTVSVYTNTTNKFNLNMTADATTLVNSSNSNYTIATLDSGTFTSSTFTNDRWGFSTDGTNYSGVATSQTIKTISTNTGNSSPNTTPVYFGLKLTQATAPGSYSRKVTFAVVAAS